MTRFGGWVRQGEQVGAPLCSPAVKASLSTIFTLTTHFRPGIQHLFHGTGRLHWEMMAATHSVHFLLDAFAYEALPTKFIIANSSDLTFLPSA